MRARRDTATRALRGHRTPSDSRAPLRARVRRRRPSLTVCSRRPLEPHTPAARGRARRRAAHCPARGRSSSIQPWMSAARLASGPTASASAWLCAVCVRAPAPATSSMASSWGAEANGSSGAGSRASALGWATDARRHALPGQALPLADGSIEIDVGQRARKGQGRTDCGGERRRTESEAIAPRCDFCVVPCRSRAIACRSLLCNAWRKAVSDVE